MIVGSVAWGEETGRVLWSFSSPVVAIGAFDGLRCNGESPLDAEVSGGAVACAYPDAVNPGDSWELDAGAVDLTFANGGVLSPAAGTVE